MKSLFKLLLRLPRCSSGNALAEMTIIIPVAISLMGGVVDFGMAFSTWATGTKSVRDAARYLGTLPSSYCSSSWAVANTQSLAVYGKLGGTDGVDTPLAPGWKMSGGNNNNVTVDCSNLPVSVVVTAKIPYNSIIVASFLPIAKTYTLSIQHEEPSIGE